MTIYVNNVYIPAASDHLRKVQTWSLFSDTSMDELHEFATKIGLTRSCFCTGKRYGKEPARIWRSHYDMNAEERTTAIRAGAHSINTLGEFYQLINRLRDAVDGSTG